MKATLRYILDVYNHIDPDLYFKGFYLELGCVQQCPLVWMSCIKTYLLLARRQSSQNIIPALTHGVGVTDLGFSLFRFCGMQHATLGRDIDVASRAPLNWLKTHLPMCVV